MRDQFGTETLVFKQRKLDPTALEHFSEFTQVMPEQMPAQMLVNLVERSDVRVRKHRSHAWWGKHVDHDKVLAANQFYIAHKAFRNDGIIKRGEKKQQGPTAQAQPYEGANFIKVGRHDLRLKGIKGVTARAVMRLAISRPQKSFDLIAEREQTEEITLLLRGQAKDEGRGDEALENRGVLSVKCQRAAVGRRVWR